MSEFKFFTTSAGIGVAITPTEGLGEFEAYLQMLNDDELLDLAKQSLRHLGDANPNLTLKTSNTTREGLLDLLVGMRAIAGIPKIPETGGGQNNSQPPMVQ